MNNKPFGIARTSYPKEKKCQKLTMDLDNNLDNDKTISGIFSTAGALVVITV